MMDLASCALGIFGVIQGSSTSACSSNLIFPQVIGPALKILVQSENTLVLSIAGFMTAHYGIAKVLEASHTGGKALQAQDALFMPLRVVLVLALSAPWASGYSGIQILTLEVAKISNDQTNLVWDKTLATLQNTSFKVMPPPPPEVSTIENNLLQSLVCSSILDQEATGSTQAITEVQQAQKLDFAASEISGYTGNPCGSYTLPTAPVNGSSTTKNIYSAQAQAFAQMTSSLWPIAQAIAQGIVNPQGTPGSGTRAKCYENNDQSCLNQPTTFPPLSKTGANPAGAGQYVGTLYGIEQTYVGKIVAAAGVGNLPLVASPQQGWWDAGEIWTGLLNREKGIVNAENAIPSLREDFTDTNFYRGQSELQEGSRETALYITGYGWGTNQSVQNNGTTAGCGSILHPFTFGQCEISNSILSQSGGDPLLGMIAVGEKLQTLGVDMYSTGLGASVLARTGKIVSKIPVFGGVVGESIREPAKAASSILKTLGEFIAIPGFLISTIIPLMPTFFWILFKLAWVVLIFESVIATPIWLLTLLDPGGTGFFGAYGTTGFRLLLSVFFRPFLGLTGLVVSLAVADLGVGFVFDEWVRMQQMIGPSGVMTETVSTVGLALFSGFMALTVTYAAVGLITYLPENIPHWFGGVGASMGENKMIQSVIQSVGQKGKELSQMVKGK